MKTPAQIQAWLDQNLHRFDLPEQWLGTEPNSARRDWATASARWCLIASWPYEAAAGNQSIPAVYKSIHDHDPLFLCDRTYLPTTPGDLRLLEKNHIPMFGIESKHELADFDVIGSSISYPVLTMSFIKLLTMSGIPARWKDRDPNVSPMVIAGGLSYGAPEVLAPVVDCWFLGEVEDEPGNPGIGAVTDRIAQYKRDDRWTRDRLGCYQSLAREFNFLYFPRFVDIHYEYEDRTHLGVGPEPSKQVVGYTSNLDGMRLPLRKRHVKDLDAIAPLDNPPLLYADPAMGSGDVEVARSCPAWCVSHSERVFVQGLGVVRVGDLAADVHEHPVGMQMSAEGVQSEVSCVVDKGWKKLVRVRTEQGHYVELTPEHQVRVRTRRSGKLSRGEFVWKQALDLVPGDVVPIHYGQHAYGEYQVLKESSLTLNEDLAWLLGFLVGDGSVHPNAKGEPCALGFGVWTGSAVEQQVKKLLWSVFGAERLNSWTIGDGKITWHRFNRISIVKPLCADLGFSAGRGTEESKLFVPDAIMRSPRSVQQAFILGLFEADGNVDADGKFVRLVSISERLCREVGLLLLNLGCANTWHSKRVSTSRGIIKGGRDIAYHLNVRPALDSDTSWWWFLTPEKEVRARAFRQVRTLDSSSANVNYLASRRSPIMARVVAVEDAGYGRVADFTVPGSESFDCGGLNVHNCSFCSLAWKSKPYRQRSIPYVMDYAKSLQDNMGSTRMAPFSPDLPMYTQRRELVAGLLENVSDEIDAASMRVDDFIADNTFILLQVQGGLDSVSLGVEGNSQRMRDLIGKGTSDNEIKQAVAQGITAGIRKFKLFMISNLPGEDEGDIYRILKLAKDLADIRESMNQPTVRIQFSWTPLIVEANTPMQWFAPQPQSRVLGDVWEEFRDLKIEFKLGSKVESNKLAFFQLCQRASRHVGEAIVDAILDADQACWGGVPRTFKDLLEQKLHAHGFRNGYADCFDERFLSDMFGWEMIDTGVSAELMWRSYIQMRELAELTDSHTYDLNFGPEYGGSEWLLRCDARCYGKACGACDHGDLKHRQRYLQTRDSDVDLSTLRPVDQTSQAQRIRLRINRNANVRFVGNDHWRFAMRRAFYQAQTTLGLPFGIAKRSIKFSSDEIKHRDWVHGIDYAELAFTRPITDDQITAMVDLANNRLDNQMNITDWKRHPVDAVGIRTDTDSFFYRLEIDEEYDHVADRLHWWTTQTDIPVRLAVQGGYFAPASEVVNAKDYVEQLWIRPDGHRLLLNMHLRPRPTPYNITAALLGKPSWFPYAKHSAIRLECCVAADANQQDFFRPNCTRCGRQIPVNILDQPYSLELCPPCRDFQDTNLVITAH